MSQWHFSPMEHLQFAIKVFRMLWCCFTRVTQTLHTGAYFPTLRLLSPLLIQLDLKRGIQCHHSKYRLPELAIDQGLCIPFSFTTDLPVFIAEAFSVTIQSINHMIDQGFVYHILLHNRFTSFQSRNIQCHYSEYRSYD